LSAFKASKNRWSSSVGSAGLAGVADGDGVAFEKSSFLFGSEPCWANAVDAMKMQRVIKRMRMPENRFFAFPMQAPQAASRDVVLF
jgi:hypothetical protein